MTNRFGIAIRSLDGGTTFEEIGRYVTYRGNSYVQISEPNYLEGPGTPYLVLQPGASGAQCGKASTIRIPQRSWGVATDGNGNSARVIGVERASVHLSTDGGATWTHRAVEGFDEVYCSGTTFFGVRAVAGRYSALGTWKSATGEKWDNISAAIAVTSPSGSLVPSVRSGGKIQYFHDSGVQDDDLAWADQYGNMTYFAGIYAWQMASNGVYFWENYLRPSEPRVVRRLEFPSAVTGVIGIGRFPSLERLRVFTTDGSWLSPDLSRRGTPSDGTVSAVPPPAVLAGFGLYPTLSLKAKIGTRVYIETSASPNGPWSRVATNIIQEESELWTDPSGAARRSWFYRIAQ